jgi:hypothetical protein
MTKNEAKVEQSKSRPRLSVAMSLPKHGPFRSSVNDFKRQSRMPQHSCRTPVAPVGDRVVEGWMRKMLSRTRKKDDDDED